MYDILLLSIVNSWLQHIRWIPLRCLLIEYARIAKFTSQHPHIKRRQLTNRSKFVLRSLQISSTDDCHFVMVPTIYGYFQFIRIRTKRSTYIFNLFICDAIKYSSPANAVFSNGYLHPSGVHTIVHSTGTHLLMCLICSLFPNG